MNKMVAAAMAAVVVAGGALAGTGVANADARVQVGRLSCDVEGGIGFLIGSSKDMSCAFIRKGHKTEYYNGNISKLGFDIGVTGHTRIEWLVFAAQSTPTGGHALAGTYVGGSGEATVGVGVGANWLIGGSRRSFALQPWSVQGQTGLNASLTFTGLRLY
jgi:hypothetical protein